MGPNMIAAELKAMTKSFITPVPGAARLLAEVRDAGVLPLCCTNNLPPWFKLQSDEIGLPRFVSPTRTITSFSYGASKSSPRFELFNAVLDAVPGLAAPRCVFVDDRHSNLERAEEFGMKAVHCDTEGGGIRAVRAALHALGVFDPPAGGLRAVAFDVGGVLAYDVWERLYLDPNDGIVARYPHLDPRELTRIGKKLWEEFAYSMDSDGRMEENYWLRFVSEVFPDA